MAQPMDVGLSNDNVLDLIQCLLACLWPNEMWNHHCYDRDLYNRCAKEIGTTGEGLAALLRKAERLIVISEGE